MVAIGVSLYAIPFIKPALRDFGAKWLVWFALNLIIIIPTIAVWYAVGGFGFFSLIMSGYFNMLAFWGSEVGKRWIGVLWL